MRASQQGHTDIVTALLATPDIYANHADVSHANDHILPGLTTDLDLF